MRRRWLLVATLAVVCLAAAPTVAAQGPATVLVEMDLRQALPVEDLLIDAAFEAACGGSDHVTLNRAEQSFTFTETNLETGCALVTAQANRPAGAVEVHWHFSANRFATDNNPTPIPNELLAHQEFWTYDAIGNLDARHHYFDDLSRSQDFTNFTYVAAAGGQAAIGAWYFAEQAGFGGNGPADPGRFHTLRGTVKQMSATFPDVPVATPAAMLVNSTGNTTQEVRTWETRISFDTLAPEHEMLQVRIRVPASSNVLGLKFAADETPGFDGLRQISDGLVIEIEVDPTNVDARSGFWLVTQSTLELNPPPTPEAVVVGPTSLLGLLRTLLVIPGVIGTVSAVYVVRAQAVSKRNSDRWVLGWGYLLIAILYVVSILWMTVFNDTETTSQWPPENAALVGFVGLASATAFFVVIAWLALLQRHERTKEEARRRLVNMASHELNTPLTPIKAQVAMLRRQMPGKLNKAQLQSLDVVARNVDRIDRTVKDILQAERLDGTQDLVKMRPHDIGHIIRDAVFEYQGQAKERGVELHSKVALDLPVKVDPERLQQVLANLLDNALKFTPEGGTVMVRAHRDRNDIAIIVEDSGRGFRAMDGVRLFGRFSRLDPNSTMPGTGLGLYICQRLTQAMGGTITAHSDGAGKGARFIVRLPRASL